MSARQARKATTTIADAQTVPDGLIWLRTDDLSRHPESQIRASPDASLVAEYAEAMLEGANFPPVIVFQDENGWKYLADGHHRVDAAALAALKDPKRKAEVLADVRQGGFKDALRHAMGANRLHGKRMSEADYKRAIKMAIGHQLIEPVHAKDVVPDIVALVGCSIRTAQENSVDKRKEMIEKRDTHILAMHREGRTQEAIGAALQVPQQTVFNVINRLTQKRGVAQTGKAEPMPVVDWSDDDEVWEPAPPAANQDADKPAYKLDVSPYLPLLDRLRPIDEGGDDLESGAVGNLPDGIESEDDSDALKAASARVASAIREMLLTIEGETDLAKPSRASTAAPVVEMIDLALSFLTEMRDYLTRGQPS